MDQTLKDEILRLRSEQAAALSHMQPGHSCGNPLCCTRNIEQWLLDTFAEEMVLTYGLNRNASPAAD
jgi:hypothetical protein